MSMFSLGALSEQLLPSKTSDGNKRDLQDFLNLLIYSASKVHSSFNPASVPIPMAVEVGGNAGSTDQGLNASHRARSMWQRGRWTAAKNSSFFDIQADDYCSLQDSPTYRDIGRQRGMRAAEDPAESSPELSTSTPNTMASPPPPQGEQENPALAKWAASSTMRGCEHTATAPTKLSCLSCAEMSSGMAERDKPRNSEATARKAAGSSKRREMTAAPGDGGSPLIPLAASGVSVQLKMTGASAKLKKQTDRRNFCFQRACSYDINPAREVLRDRPTRSCRSSELEMTSVEMQHSKGESNNPENTSTNNAYLFSLESHDLLGPEGTMSTVSGGGELKSSDRDTGIVCSDEDLRSILTDVTQTRRLSAEVKREKMKSNRSLSLDSSSFFKVHMKRLQPDGPNSWLARILSQRPERGGSKDSAAASGTAGNSGTGIPDGDGGGSSSDLLLRKKSVCKKPEMVRGPGTIREDPSSSSLEDAGLDSSRRQSAISVSDDECSLLLVNRSDSPPCPSAAVTGSATAPGKSGSTDGGRDGNKKTQLPPPPPPVVASKVVWNDSSVVDAEVVGHAIELYLKSVGKRASTGSADNCSKTGKNDGTVSSEGASSSDNVSIPMMSTLKGLFVK